MRVQDPRIETNNRVNMARALAKDFPKPKKIKKQSRKAIIKRLDHLVSLYVLKRDVRCVVCGSDYQLGCGHLFSRRFYSLRWNMLNCHLQCWRCNFLHNRNPHPYTNWFVNKFGQEAYNELFEQSQEVTHLKDKDLLDIEAKLVGL